LVMEHAMIELVIQMLFLKKCDIFSETYTTTYLEPV